MDESLTDQAARAQVYSYLRRTLAEMPAGVSWSLVSDSVHGGPLDPGVTLVCSDDGGATPLDTPVSVQVSYWLNGVRRGHERAYFERLLDVWRGWGWVERPGALAEWASYSRPDEPESYVLGAQYVPDRSVSVSVSTPCFWSKDDATVDPPLRDAQPKVIERPAD